MKVKEIWTDKDFEEMGWHDCHIHSIRFSNDDLNMILDIDYPFEWVLNKDTGLFNFWISPCYLVFYYTLKLKIELDYKASIGLNMDQIVRTPLLSPNGSLIYEYTIETDMGIISFQANNFVQKVVKQPIYSQSLVLDRPDILI